MLVKRCETVSCCARKEDAQLSSSLSHTASSFPIPPISSLLLFLLLVACPILCAPFAAHFLYISSLYPCFSGSLCVRVRVCGCYLVSVFFFCMQTEIVFFPKPFFFSFRSASLFSLGSSSLSSSGLSLLLLLLFSLSLLPSSLPLFRVLGVVFVFPVV